MLKNDNQAQVLNFDTLTKQKLFFSRKFIFHLQNEILYYKNKTLKFLQPYNIFNFYIKKKNHSPQPQTN